MATRVDTVDTTEEFAVVAHLRGWCHDSTACRICVAENRAHVAEQALAHTTRVLEMRGRLIEARLESVISG
jgi:hypothetical protein